MEKIISSVEIAPRIHKIVITAPQIAKMWQPGQFLIIHLNEDSERIPLTICKRDIEKGELTLIVQAIGESTREICGSPAGSEIRDVLGPLGMPSDIDERSLGNCKINLAPPPLTYPTHASHSSFQYHKMAFVVNNIFSVYNS